MYHVIKVVNEPLGHIEMGKVVCLFMPPLIELVRGDWVHGHFKCGSVTFASKCCLTHVARLSITQA